MSKKYGTYTNEELNNWQNLPANSMVLISSGFGAWLLRRDERKGNRDLINELEKIKSEINGFCKGYLCTPQPEAIADDINEHIINKRIAELKGEQDV